MDFKNILRLILGVLLPIAYIAIKTKYPDFPLNQNAFVDAIIWVIGLLIGGWQLAIFYYSKFSSKYVLVAKMQKVK